MAPVPLLSGCKPIGGLYKMITCPPSPRNNFLKRLRLVFRTTERKTLHAHISIHVAFCTTCRILPTSTPGSLRSECGAEVRQLCTRHWSAKCAKPICVLPGVLLNPSKQLVLRPQALPRKKSLNIMAALSPDPLSVKMTTHKRLLAGKYNSSFHVFSIIPILTPI